MLLFISIKDTRVWMAIADAEKTVAFTLVVIQAASKVLWPRRNQRYPVALSQC